MEIRWTEAEYQAERWARAVNHAKDHLASQDPQPATFMGVDLKHFTAEELQKIVVIAMKQSQLLCSP